MPSVDVHTRASLLPRLLSAPTTTKPSALAAQPNASWLPPPLPTKELSVASPGRQRPSRPRRRTATSKLLSWPLTPTARAWPSRTQTSRKRWVPGPLSPVSSLTMPLPSAEMATTGSVS
jgi:hypothetical protein